jgi:hypothetical protein
MSRIAFSLLLIVMGASSLIFNKKNAARGVEHQRAIGGDSFFAATNLTVNRVLGVIVGVGLVTMGATILLGWMPFTP